VASILFIDNPVGTGYSYVTHDSAFTTDVYQIAQDLMTTVTAFLNQLPDFQVEIFVLIFNSTMKYLQSHFCKHWPRAGCGGVPAPFPDRMSYKATKPGLICLSYLGMFYYVAIY